MIQSFKTKELEHFFTDDQVPKKAGWANVRSIVRRKLAMLDAAQTINDLKVPPGNHLEALKLDLVGFYSVRVNDQWRVVFRWSSGSPGPSEVSVVDYH